MKGRTQRSWSAKRSAFLDYVSGGEHAFLACDDTDLLCDIVKELQGVLIERSSEFIDCSDIASLLEFSKVFGSACERLVSTLGFLSALKYRSRNRQYGIANDLGEAMDLFSAKQRQGYLVISQIDGVISKQKTIELEGPMRSVMQLKSGIAVVLCGSHRTIDMLIGDSHRPFYMSFRPFRF